jgi:hypothetical protein
MTDTYTIPADEQFVIEAATNEDAIEMAQLLIDCIDGAVEVYEAKERWDEAQESILNIAKRMYEVAEVEEV